MKLPHDHIDPEGLEEFSVVFTDRSLNHMSARFQQVMRDVSGLLREVYNGEAVALVPGGGSYAMESVARQFGRGRALVIRNGFFSFRWSQIFDMGGFAESVDVVMARASGNQPRAPFAPPPIAEVVAKIRETKPDAVFAPHVETASGIILPDDYIRAIGEAAREVGALFVLDCIASGTIWVDMVENNVDVLISAPQKGWSASPAAGIVVMGKRAAERLEASTSNSFALDLKKWRAMMKAYEDGGHAYHATMPTDAIQGMRDAMFETRDMGFAAAKAAQQALGRAVRDELKARGILSVAAEGFEAPGVVVSYTDDPAVQNGSKFREIGTQIAAGVPLQIGEGEAFRSFRLGLFGLDKLKDVEGTVKRLKRALDQVF
ncbi:aminotransferase class V-fold PLP-dependent enzyme [Pseudogemmobacter faecipullorum]|uniref:Alanine--glyoxylate aminotransferase family protein n=1 Tax=Pseudogemmobacter faecipullorum TaxID=2755041 RepID=A0ABS8CME2_9RHOB|nr:aminotransferase class V-fold PLP-dependent enzyme [Pseudogemmobacter faecipullorum]MCB5410558.1 alanine--glyoxylate aminotransferase family protein [Pseudogemmobacter faecipullorum]